MKAGETTCPQMDSPRHLVVVWQTHSKAIRRLDSVGARDSSLAPRRPDTPVASPGNGGPFAVGSIRPT